MAQTICAEAGKPIKTARVEASRAVSTYTFAAVEARKLAGDVVPMDASEAGEGKIAFTLRRPIGVIGAISPFNFPCNLVAHKLAPALAAGCPVVLKPASQTPLSALLLAELEQEAGLPAGWLTVLVGPSAEIGDVLVEDERVRMITFTGSSGVGWGIAERAAQKRVRLELGNSTPVVVAADADLDLAATKLAANAFSFAGQSCISVQRIYVERPVARRLPRALPAEGRGARRRRPGRRGDRRRAGDRRRTRATRIAEWVEEAAGRRREAPRRLDRRRPAPARSCSPTRPSRRASSATRSSARSASSTRSTRSRTRTRARTAPSTGCRPGVFTGSISTALAAAEALEFGGVTVNEAPTFRADQMPYGGVKGSGNTKEGPAYTIREMTEERLVVLQAWTFPFPPQRGAIPVIGVCSATGSFTATDNECGDFVTAPATM